MEAIDSWNNSESPVIKTIVSDLAEWVKAGFDILDFPLPKWTQVDCNMARSILNNAGIR